MCIDNLKGFLFMEGLFSIGHFTVVLVAKPIYLLRETGMKLLK